MENYVDTLSRWVTFYGLKIFGAILILVIGIWLSKRIRNILKNTLTKKNVDLMIVSFSSSVIYYLLLFVVVIAALTNIGVQTTSIIAIFAAASLAVAFALQNSLSNFASGIMIILLRPFSINDFVQVGGVSGGVESMGIFTTTLNTPDNKKIYIPNSKITDDIITNFTANDTRRIDFVFSVSYDDDITKVKKTLMDLVKKDPRILNDPAPQVILLEYADSSINFGIRAWAKKEDYWIIYWDMNENVKNAFDAADITIPYPQTDIHLQNKAKIEDPKESR